MNQYLELGKVNNTHGLKGEVKFELWCDGIDYIKQLKKVYLDNEGKQSLTLVGARPQKHIAILKFREIQSVEEAEQLKNKILYCNRDDATIDEDAYYLADVIGCFVIDADSGKTYGKIVDVMNYGSCDIYDVKTATQHTLVPAIPDIIDQIDTDNGEVRIRPMKGLFDEN